MKNYITAAMLYDWVRCPHRVSLDLFGDPGKRDAISTFVRLLWEKGTLFERKVVETLELPFTDLTGLKGDEKEKATAEAMHRGDPLIYSGRISHDHLLGVPDILKKTDKGYVAGDIKSGSGLEGGSDLEEGKPKKHYALQLALYTDILEQRGFLSQRIPFVWDIQGREIPYPLDDPGSLKETMSLWDHYRRSLREIEQIMAREMITRPALSAVCKLCQWRTWCKKEAERLGDLTLIPELGRSRRDRLMIHIGTLQDMAELDPVERRSELKIKGIGLHMIKKYQIRAKLLSTARSKPVLTQKIRLPGSPVELFFDIETDPMRDICYLHGFVVRLNGDSHAEEYRAIFAPNPDESHEKQAFSRAVDFIRSYPSAIIFYYSKYERNVWRKLQEKYPDVIEKEQIEAIFSPERAVDLYYDVVKKATEWPTHDHSIKTLARYLGFQWRDEDPSGASSIEWYYRWVETGDPSIKKRILDYNEDDCRATRVLLDGLKKMIEMKKKRIP